MINLPVVKEERWDDGTLVTFFKIPFPYRRKPIVTDSRMHDISIMSVPLDLVFGSQKTVTCTGLHKKIPGKPLVYLEADDTFTIGDGHHRFTQAALKGKKTVRSHVVHATDT